MFVPQNEELVEKNKFKAQILASIKKIARGGAEEKEKIVEKGPKSVVTDALCGLFYAVVAKDLRNQALPFFNIIVRQLTIQAMLEGEEQGLNLWLCNDKLGI